MPKSGQKWEPERFFAHDAFTAIAHLLDELVPLPTFPGLDVLSSLVEKARQRRDESLSPLLFVPMSPKPKRFRRRRLVLSELYDARIACAHEVPCLNESYHDLFNALAFATFPRAKRLLHQRQYRALTRWIPEGAHRLPSARTREQDALTLFDEGGTVVVLNESLRDSFRYPEDELSLHASRRDARLIIFGHALFEHLAEGRSAMRSSARVLYLPQVPQGPEIFDIVDDWLWERLSDPTQFAEPDADAVVCFQPENPPVAHPASYEKMRKNTARSTNASLPV